MRPLNQEYLFAYLEFLAVAGKDFIVCCTDTRISSGYSILKRDHKKTTKLTATCMITSGGMVADIDALHKNLLTRIRIYKMQNKREPTIRTNNWNLHPKALPSFCLTPFTDVASCLSMPSTSSDIITPGKGGGQDGGKRHGCYSALPVR